MKEWRNWALAIAVALFAITLGSYVAAVEDLRTVERQRDRVANAFERQVSRGFDPACWKDGEAGAITSTAYHECKTVAQVIAKRKVADHMNGKSQ